MRRPHAAPPWGGRGPAVLLSLLLLQLLPAHSSDVCTLMSPLGDIGLAGAPGPHGRDGHSAVVTDDSRMLIFGGRSDYSNGDFLNDVWLYDWNTGNWTAYEPNELVCDACDTCGSELANQLRGSTFIKSDGGTYIACSNATTADTASWMALSVAARALGATCAYHITCYDWTGLRPYSQPKLETGSLAVSRQVPSGRYAHAAALVQSSSGQRDLMVLYGGYSIDCTDYCDDLWHYSLPDNVWVRIVNQTRPRPARRWKHAMVDVADTVVLFGGHGQRLPPLTSASEVVRENEIYDRLTTYDPENPLYFDDLWVYNATEREWERLYPNCTTCANGTRLEQDGTPTRDVTGPRGRVGASLASYDGRVYLFGGYAYGGQSAFAFEYPTGSSSTYASLNSKYYLDDLWVLDLANLTWTQLEPPKEHPTLPAPRYGHAAALSRHGNDVIMLVFGGLTWDDEIGDMFQYNISSGVWTLVSGEGSFPSRRGKLAMVPVGQAAGQPQGSTAQAGRMLIWGGHGCLLGETYLAASKAKAAALSTALVPGVDLFVQVPSSYGEKYCLEELADLWQYFPTACAKDCSRHGVCDYNVCVCASGFTGYDCSNVTCPGSQCYFDYAGRMQVCQHCNGYGSCNGFTGSCACVYPASGPSCAQLECLNDCSGHGVCDHITPNAIGYGTCTCDTLGGVPVYAGLDCSVAICNVLANSTSAPQANACNEGTCVNGTCSCYPGFGPSLLYRTGPGGVGRVPIDAAGVPLAAGAELVYAVDCGSLLFELSAAGLGSRPAGLVGLLIIALATWLLGR